MKVLSFLCLFFISISIFSQVGINTVSPDASSILDISATNKGLLIPRVNLGSLTDMATITNPAKSLLVYKTGYTPNMPEGFYFFDGSQWSALTGETGGGGGATNAWNITGNNNTNSNHFLGTLNYAEVNFRANNIAMGNLHPRGSVAWGRGATASCTNSMALGYQSTASQTEATALGPNSQASGSSSLSIGASSKAAQTDAMAVGVQSVSTGNKGMALGYGSNVSQTEAMAVGSFSSVSGSKSTALGHSSQVSQTEAMALGYNAKASGSHSFAAGHSPEASGNKALAIGEGARSTANETIAIGNGSLSNANKSLAIGNGAQAIANNAVAIGNDAIANQQNTLILGAVNGGPSVGIGTASPSARLDVNDSFKLGQKGSVHKGMASFVENYLNVQVNANSTAIAMVTIPTEIRLTGTQATVIVTLDNGVSDDISVVWSKLRDSRTIRLQIRNSGTANWSGGKMYFTVIEF
ncbi:hypothetical protein F3C99_12665 [Vitellibacter sp. q18]|nr:hypothetical protein [Aequorivita lutea]